MVSIWTMTGDADAAYMRLDARADPSGNPAGASRPSSLNLLGPILVGVLLNSFVYGVVFLHWIQYTLGRNRDRPLLKYVPFSPSAQSSAGGCGLGVRGGAWRRRTERSRGAQGLVLTSDRRAVELKANIETLPHSIERPMKADADVVKTNGVDEAFVGSLG